jgi:hypothetical protein
MTLRLLWRNRHRTVDPQELEVGIRERGANGGGSLAIMVNDVRMDVDPGVPERVPSLRRAGWDQHEEVIQHEDRVGHGDGYSIRTSRQQKKSAEDMLCHGSLPCAIQRLRGSAARPTWSPVGASRKASTLSSTNQNRVGQNRRVTRIQRVDRGTAFLGVRATQRIHSYAARPTLVICERDP